MTIEFTREFPSRLPLILAALSLSGCVVVRPRPEPVSPEEIIRLSEEGVPPEEIIEKIRASRTVYRMDAEDVVRLDERGVDKQVIDFMMDTERRAIKRRYYYGSYYYGPYYYDPFWYGPCWYGYPYYRVGIGYSW